MLIIPAIDIIDNSVVRLSKGKYEDVTNYKQTPLEQACLYDALGYEWLHCVDLIGSKEGKINILGIIKEIKNNTKLKIEVGGGIRKAEDVNIMVSEGVDRVLIGSMAVNNKDELEKAVNKNSPDKIVIAADVLDNRVRIKGWTEDGGVMLTDHITHCRTLGIDTFLVTDINKDGLLSGPSFDLYENIMKEFRGINLIASGGVSSMCDIIKLSEMNCYAVVVGKAIYENKIDVKELAKFGN
jgi:phosphoribosylformimino-5-aminoimidazole carboxamide ribotide isomerase